MMNKLKNYLTYVFCAVLGFFNFILLAIPYIASYYSYDLGEWGKQSDSSGISGYKIMDLWELKFSGVMSSLIQLFVLLLGIALLVWGVLGLLKAFGIFNKFPDRLGKFESKKIGEFGLFAIAGLNVLLLIFLIILTATNSESYSEYGYESSAGFRLSAGIFISLVITVGAVVTLKVLKKRLPLTDVGGESITYVCDKCGKKAKAKDKFCSDCGGEIKKKVEIKEQYVCEKCGKKATAKDKFCNACGGAVVVKKEEAKVETASIEDVKQQ